MMRICYVIPTLGVGGTEGQVVQLLHGLVRGNDLSVVCTRKDGALSGDARRMGIDVRVIGGWSGWDFTTERKFLHLFRHNRPDVVHSFMFGFDLWANRAARRAGVPVLVSSRRQQATWKKRRHVALQRLANRYVDCIVANSNAAAEFAQRQEGADPALFRVIHNGIRADDFVSSADPKLVRKRYKIPFHRHIIGIVANFSPVKDHALFVDAARALIARRADVHFVMAGIGPLLETTQRRILDYGIEDCFTRITTIAELPDLYSLMDCCVLCSKTEGFPNAVIESMAAGTPVVAAATGGTVELVRHGETGRLVSTRNPEDFAAEMEWVLTHPEESGAMARNAARFVRRELAVEKMAGAYRALYAELLANPPRKGR